MRPTPGHPMVVAQAKASRRDALHLLFYGHYDVQPVDPLDLGERSVRREDRRRETESQIYGRSHRRDDKGQLMTTRRGLPRLPRHGRPALRRDDPAEGEGGDRFAVAPGLRSPTRRNCSRLALVCDTGMWDRTTPAITTAMLRPGARGDDPRRRSRPASSGLYGGAAVNRSMSRRRSSPTCTTPQGRITISNFYDGVAELPDEVAGAMARTRFRREGVSRRGRPVSVPAGEADRSVLQQIWSVRPAT